MEMRVGVTYKIRTFTLGDNDGFHPPVAGASFDPRAIRCKNLEYQVFRHLVVQCNWTCNRSEIYPADNHGPDATAGALSLNLLTICSALVEVIYEVWVILKMCHKVSETRLAI